MPELTDSAEIDAADSCNSASPRKNVKTFLPLLVLLLPVAILWGITEDEIASKPESTVQPVEVEPTLDEKYRELLVGQWETDRDGRRFLTVKQDGTAEMDVEVASNWSLLFGKKLKFFIEWTIENGVLTMKTTGGEPQGKVDLITNMYGAERTQAIKILDETTLQLPDEEPDEEDHIWTRVAP